jgi:ribA/ribD-fused uncharacterized protein
MKILNPQNINFVKILRLGMKKSTKPRPIMIQLASISEREVIWSAKKQLKGSSVIIREDFSKETSKYIASIVPIMKAARKANMKANIVGDTLYVDGKRYARGQINNLPDILHPVSKVEDEHNLAFFGSESPLSNFYKCNFVVGDQSYTSVEQYYQAAKASLNDQLSLRDEIMNSNDPSDQKSIGSRIKINRSQWETKAPEIMHNGLMAKFSQNADLCSYLSETNNKTLFEANSRDLFWGTGIPLSNINVLRSKYHKGQNMLGRILMTIRSQLSPSPTEEKMPEFAPPNYTTPSVEADVVSNIE